VEGRNEQNAYFEWKRIKSGVSRGVPTAGLSHSGGANKGPYKSLGATKGPSGVRGKRKAEEKEFYWVERLGLLVNGETTKISFGGGPVATITWGGSGGLRENPGRPIGRGESRGLNRPNPHQNIRIT